MSARRTYFSTVSSWSRLPWQAQDSCATVETVVSKILAMLDSDRARICRLLMQMALSDDSPASKAVLQSILALASLHRDGDQAGAARLKLSALSALLASTENGISAKSGIQHIAAGMLLCAYEVRIELSSNWPPFSHSTTDPADNRNELSMGGTSMWREKRHQSRPERAVHPRERCLAYTGMGLLSRRASSLHPSTLAHSYGQTHCCRPQFQPERVAIVCSSIHNRSYLIRDPNTEDLKLCSPGAPLAL